MLAKLNFVKRSSKSKRTSEKASKSKETCSNTADGDCRMEVVSEREPMIVTNVCY